MFVLAYSLRQTEILLYMFRFTDVQMLLLFVVVFFVFAFL